MGYLLEVRKMAAATNIAGRGRLLTIAYIVLVVVLTVVAIGGSIAVHRFEYTAGTRNDAKYSVVYGFGLFVALFLVMAPIAGGASFVALISLVLGHRNLRQISLKLGMILLGPIICFCAFEYEVPLAPVFLEGFEQWVLQEADIDGIQTWLASEGAKHAGKHYSAQEDFGGELPECLVELKPMLVSFSDSVSPDGPRVEIIWLLFMDEYGLIVGPPTMDTPEKGRIKLKKAFHEFRRPVKPGAYVFTRG